MLVWDKAWAEGKGKLAKCRHRAGSDGKRSKSAPAPAVIVSSPPVRPARPLELASGATATGIVIPGADWG
jgi:hypothetical protein